jgi:hypothetical protein
VMLANDAQGVLYPVKNYGLTNNIHILGKPGLNVIPVSVIQSEYCCSPCIEDVAGRDAVRP